MRRVIFTILCLFIIFMSYAQVNVLNIEQLTYRDGLPNNSVQSIKQDKNGFIWFSSFAGLCRYDGYTFYEYLPNPENDRTIYTKSVYNMMLDSAQNLWIAFFDTSLYCVYNDRTNDFLRVSSIDVPKYIKDKSNRRNMVPNVAEIESERWELKNKKLYRYDKVNKEERTYFLSFQQSELFDDSRVRTMFVDSFGTLWIGTEDKGVFKVNINTKPFYTFLFQENGQQQVFNNIVRAIYEDERQNLYIGTQYDGIYLLNRKSQTIQRIGGPDRSDYQRLRDNQIRCIFEDSQGHIWIGTKGGVSEYFPQSGRIRNYNRFGTVNIPHNWAYAVGEDQQGDIWVGTFGGGLARYNRQTDRFTHIDPFATLANSKVYCLLIDSKNRIWAGTHGGGLSCLTKTNTPDKYDCTHYLNEPGNSNSLSSNRIFSLYEDREGKIWVATDYGLNVLDPESGNIRRYFHKDGLSDDIVFSVVEDNNGNIWMSNQKGISMLDRRSGNFSHYNEKDGLQGNEMSENTVFKNPRTGELVFGSLHGLISFFPDQIVGNHILPKIVLTRFEVLNQEVVPGEKINNRVILRDHISMTDKIVLNYSHRSFSIEFAALHFTNPMGNEYEYMLEKFDDQWIRTTASRRYATYSNLPAGKYLFKVRASNDDGVWNPEERTLSITIRPPWWFSVWAFIVYVIIISSISYFSILYIVARMKMKNEVRFEKMNARKVQELNEMKEKFFTKISHELRTPLSLLLDPLRKLNAKAVDPGDLDYYYTIMYQNAQRLSKLVNELLDFKKIESKEFKLKASRGDLVQFLSNIINTFKISVAERGLMLKYSTGYESIEAVFDKDVLEKIVFNLISNAIKHNRPGGEISIEVRTLNHDAKGRMPVELVFSDNGSGISPESIDKIFDLYYQENKTNSHFHEGSGIGLSLTRELVLLQEGQITVKSEPGIGSVFTVVLPIALNAIVRQGGQNEEQFVVEEQIEEQEKPAPIEPDDDEPAERYCILVVEDNDDVRGYVRKDLEPLFDVIEAANGVEGWKQVLDYLPDLVISDLMMPEMDGYELCRKIKSEKRTSHIPVIVLTALTSEKAALEAIENGADAFVNKPFSSTLLRARVKNLISNRKILIENFGKQPFIDVKKIAGNSIDEAFLNSAVELIEEYISEPEFNIDLLSDKLSMSRRHLSHKIKTLTGQTVNEFVKTVRLNKGVEMMLNTDQTISEIAYQLGYTAPANFSRSFSKQFGKTPTEYIASILENQN